MKKLNEEGICIQVILIFTSKQPNQLSIQHLFKKKGIKKFKISGSSDKSGNHLLLLQKKNQ